MKIRIMNKADIPHVTRIISDAIHPNAAKAAGDDFARCFRPQVKDFYRLLNFWVAEEEGKAIGIIGVGSLHSTPSHVAWMDWFSIAPEYQGKGIGSLLLQHMQHFLKNKKVSILVVECYLPYGEDAIRFYTKHGFIHVGRIAKYWTHTIDSVLLVKHL